jgi:hypothetical protein
MGSSYSARSVIKYSSGCGFLVEAKRHLSGSDLRLCLPEAVGQAIVWATLKEYVNIPFTRYSTATKSFSSANEMHFCLTNGQSWIFCVLIRTLDAPSNSQAHYAYHTSSVLKIDREILEKEPSQELLKLIHIVGQWVSLSPELIICTYHSVSYARHP